MIIADLEHIDEQVPMTPALRIAFDFLCLRGLPDLPDGNIEIKGDQVFAIIQRYVTVKNDTPAFEYHRKYIDIQFIVSGEEIIGWAPIELMEISKSYDAGKDICFGTVKKGKWTPVTLQAGHFVVLWPGDGHAPKLAAGEPSRVVKVVVKVAV